jgi:predicted dehydrogenase
METALSKAKLGIGVLSWAHGHVNAYANQIRNFDDARMVACWDDNEERGRKNAETFGMSYSPRLEDVLNNPEVDCVVVASETNKHPQLCIAAAEAGKAILLQKPMALSLPDCDRITAAVEKAGVWFSLAYQMRCDPQNIHMKRLIEQGAIGRVGIVRRRHCIGVLFNKGFTEGPSKWHISREANRGMWMDDASHPCDWLVWMFGRPVSVIAEIDNVLTDVAPDDAGFAIFRYHNGMMAEIHNSSVTLAGENTTEIYGDRGVIIQNHGDGPSSAIKPPSPIGVKLFQSDKAEMGWQDQGVPIPTGHGERIAGVARPFIDALKAGVPLCSAGEGRISVEMVLGAYQAASAGKRVLFS